MSMLARVIWGFVALVGCADEPSGPPPLATVPGTLGRLAVNDTSLFAVDSTDSSLIEIGLDGTVVGKLPTMGAVSEVVAFANWVAWIEVEGTGKIVRRRKASGMIESARTLAPHIVATAEGLVYSDTGLVALWADGVPSRIATPAAGATVLAVDASWVYTAEANTSAVRYARSSDMSEVLLPTSMNATVKDGQLAHRTAEGIRERDLFTGFDRIVGAPPTSYTCELLIAGRAVLCGMYRALEGTTDELLTDPVGGYVSLGKDVYWASNDGGATPRSSIRKVDAELVTKAE